MNFIAASLLYHASEVCTFWLLIGLMDKFWMKEIFEQGLPGVAKHEKMIEKLGRKTIPEVFSHFVRTQLPIFLTPTYFCRTSLIS
jgi:hypothetical protein